MCCGDPLKPQGKGLVAYPITPAKSENFVNNLKSPPGGFFFDLNFLNLFWVYALRCLLTLHTCAPLALCVQECQRL